MSRGRRILVLGGGDGWHADQLRTEAQKIDSQIAFTDYESLTASVASVAEIQCGAGRLHDFDSVLTRTMPAGSLEKITFRLACMHSLVDQGQHLVNHPRSLEIAIDKFATLAKVSQSGYPVPRTRVAQDRHSAMRAFHEFDGDCVVKPVFGGEGRGVMRIRDPQLAVYTFATLDQLDSVFYVQEFVSPGGADTRMLVVGDHVFGAKATKRNRLSDKRQPWFVRPASLAASRTGRHGHGYLPCDRLAVRFGGCLG